MTEVIIESITVTELLEIVQSLRKQLIMHEDFRYKFIQGGFDWEMNEEINHRAIFYFKDPATATWFNLTYL